MPGDCPASLHILLFRLWKTFRSKPNAIPVAGKDCSACHRNRCSASDRNAVRLHNGMAFSFRPESRSPSTGFPKTGTAAVVPARSTFGTSLTELELNTPQARRKVGLGMRLDVAVHPGCTNLGLSALLHSRTNAGDESRIGCSQARAKTEYKLRMESVAHALILGEHKANVNSPGTLRFLAIGDAQRYSVGRAPALDGQSQPFLWKTPSVDSQGAESRYSRRAQAVRSNP